MMLSNDTSASSSGMQAPNPTEEPKSNQQILEALPVTSRQLFQMERGFTKGCRDDSLCVVTPEENTAPQSSDKLGSLLATSSRGESVTLDQFKLAVGTSRSQIRKRGVDEDDDEQDNITTVKKALVPANESILSATPAVTVVTDLTEPEMPTVELRRNLSHRLHNPTFREMVLKWYKQINKVWQAKYG